MENNLIAFLLSTFFCVLGVLIIVICCFLIQKEFRKEEQIFNRSIIWFSLGGVFISIFLILGTLIVKEKIEKYNTEIWNSKNKTIEETNTVIDYQGTIGDLFGGIFGPIVGLIGAILAGMAFFAQYRANQDIKKQFKLQQFESQFYEMLALHKDNMNEMKIEGYEFDENGKEQKKDTTGKKIFYTMNTELICIYLIAHKISLDADSNNDDNFLKKVTSDKRELFILSYIVFFHGIAKSQHIYKDEIASSFLGNFFNELERLVKCHKNKKKLYEKYFDKYPKEFFDDIDLKLYFNYKPFDGHQSRLGHYYRHLLSMINHVVVQKEISYEEKRDYLKILRAQFSIYELTLLFYNYYSGYGIKWENKYFPDEESRKGNCSFFLDYRFLHNIEADYRFKHIDPFEILKNDFEKKREQIQCKKGFDLNSDPVFELNDSFKTKK